MTERLQEFSSINELTVSQERAARVYAESKLKESIIASERLIQQNSALREELAQQNALVLQLQHQTGSQQEFVAQLEAKVDSLLTYKHQYEHLLDEVQSLRAEQGTVSYSAECAKHSFAAQLREEMAKRIHEKEHYIKQLKHAKEAFGEKLNSLRDRNACMEKEAKANRQAVRELQRELRAAKQAARSKSGHGRRKSAK